MVWACISAWYALTDCENAGYTGNSLDLKIIIAFLIGLSLYNAVELIVLILVTFNKYRGLYFWSLIVSGVGIIPYALGFLIKFYQCSNSFSFDYKIPLFPSMVLSPRNNLNDDSPDGLSADCIS